MSEAPRLCLNPGAFCFIFLLCIPMEGVGVSEGLHSALLLAEWAQTTTFWSWFCRRLQEKSLLFFQHLPMERKYCCNTWRLQHWKMLACLRWAKQKICANRKYIFHVSLALKCSLLKCFRSEAVFLLAFQ